jgi:hypothetical protein
MNQTHLTPPRPGILRSIGLCARATAGLILIVFLGLLAWQLFANFWALGIGGMAIVSLVIFTLYSLGSADVDAKSVEKKRGDMALGLVEDAQPESPGKLHRTLATMQANPGMRMKDAKAQVELDDKPA